MVNRDTHEGTKMSKYSDISNRAIKEQFAAYSVGLAVPAINAGSAATLKTTQSPAASLLTVINGVPKLKADLSAQVITALAALQNPITGQDTFYVQPVSTTVYYVIVVNGSGTVYVIQGTYSGQTFTAFKNALGTGAIPDIAVPNLYAPIGAFKVVTDSTHTFTPATTALDAAGVTVTYCSLNRLPDSVPTFA